MGALKFYVCACHTVNVHNSRIRGGVVVGEWLCGISPYVPLLYMWWVCVNQCSVLFDLFVS